MRRLGKECGNRRTDWWTLIRSMAAFVLFTFSLVLNVADASAQTVAATITSTGSILASDGTVIPPFPRPGRWTEFQGKSSDRYETRHFMYIAPGEAPAIELYVTTDKRGQEPDGVFEMGLVQGFIRGFASKAGFTHEEPTFAERDIGAATTRNTSVQLSNGKRTLWVHAYVYPRTPSLTFIAVTGKEGMEEGIEKYLSRVRVK